MVDIRDKVYAHIPKVYAAEREVLAHVIRRRQLKFILGYVQDAILAIHSVKKSDIPDAQRPTVFREKVKDLQKLFTSMEEALYTADEMGHTVISNSTKFVNAMLV